MEIVDVKPSPYVSTPATSQKPLDFSITLKNHLRNDFRGLLRVRGQSLETGREINLRPYETATSNLVVRTALPLSAQPQGSNVAVLSICRSENHRERNIRVMQSAGVNGRKVGYVKLPYVATRAAALGLTRLVGVDEMRSRSSVFNTSSSTIAARVARICSRIKLLKFVPKLVAPAVSYRVNEWNTYEKAIAATARAVSDPFGTSALRRRCPAPFSTAHPLLTFKQDPAKGFREWSRNALISRGVRTLPPSWQRDKGVPSLKGGLLVAPYGRGNYIYTSFVWYRQLRAGLPGGYRFFANLISYGRRRED